MLPINKEGSRANHASWYKSRYGQLEKNILRHSHITGKLVGTSRGYEKRKEKKRRMDAIAGAETSSQTRLEILEGL